MVSSLDRAFKLVLDTVPGMLEAVVTICQESSKCAASIFTLDFGRQCEALKALYPSDYARYTIDTERRSEIEKYVFGNLQHILVNRQHTS